MDGFRVAFAAVVLGVTRHHGYQLDAHLGDWGVPASPQLVVDLGELGAQAFSRGMPMHDELARSGAFAGVNKPQERTGTSPAAHARRTASRCRAWSACWSVRTGWLAIRTRATGPERRHARADRRGSWVARAIAVALQPALTASVDAGILDLRSN